MFETLFNFLDTIVNQNIAGMVTKFVPIITPIFGAAIGLYIVYLAWEAFFDTQNMMFMESIKTIAALSVVTAIALNTPWYMQNIVPFVLGSGDQITAGLMGEDARTAIALQRLSDQFMADIGAMWGSIVWEFSMDTLGTAITVCAMIALSSMFFIPFIGIATAYLLMAKIAISFLLILGPMFVMMALFPSTREFFKAWTGQCFNYTLLSILYPITFGFSREILNKTVFAENISLENILMSVILFFALCLIAVQIPVLSSTLSGGIGISGLVGNTVSGVKAAVSGAKGARQGFNRAKSFTGKTVEKAKTIGKGNISSG